MKYRYADGFQVSGLKPETVGAEFEAIVAKYGHLSPATIVKVSKGKRSPLHSYFEWDNEKAAARWREQQASYLIRAIVTVVEGSPEPVRAFVSVKTEDEQSVYTPVRSAMANPMQRDEIIERALDDLRAFRKRYEHLKELAAVFEAIDQVLEGSTR